MKLDDGDSGAGSVDEREGREEDSGGSGGGLSEPLREEIE
ncbi:hypothetical protein A2U01_0067861, partial [Trifolium medium]|nr:hypothetical protein [Trifolium medium]